MQNQKQVSPSQTLSNDKLAAPREIDASLLHLVSGGAPKSTWSVQTLSIQAPKSTW